MDSVSSPSGPATDSESRQAGTSGGEADAREARRARPRVTGASRGIGKGIAIGPRGSRGNGLRHGPHDSSWLCFTAWFSR